MRKAMKSRGREGRNDGRTVKKTFVLDEQTASRLGAFAGHHRRSQSSVVAEALAVALRGFSVSQRGPSEAGEGLLPPGDAA